MLFIVKIYRFRTVSSTQDIARELAEDGVKEGIVIADMQTKGRGRADRIWHSPSGGLWLSIILRPKVEPVYCLRLVLILGLAVVRAIRAVTGLNALIKWPNDVVIDGKKVCGILIESETVEDLVKYVIIGVGINVNVKLEELPLNVRAEATSLSEKLGGNVSNEEVLRALLTEFKALYKLFLRGETGWINEYREKSCILGRDVNVTNDAGLTICGTAVDVDDYGRLVVKLSDKTVRRLDYGEVARLRIHI
jgi:BirA family biotin operon repressor/biotin-[acetyl-CoA-carboxylase] ligase